MPKFYYHIFHKNPDTSHRQVWCDIEEAPTKKDLLLKINNDLSLNLKLRELSKDLEAQRIFMTELTPYWEEHWLTVRECKECGNHYTLLDRKQSCTHATPQACSIDCLRLSKRLAPGVVEDYIITVGGSFKPCIYKITNKITNKVYIGQTTQAVTLRWYQHITSSLEDKFHTEFKTSKLTDWSYEVIEILDKTTRREISEREMHWINYYNSIEEGYNTAKPIKLEEKDK